MIVGVLPALRVTRLNVQEGLQIDDRAHLRHDLPGVVEVAAYSRAF